MMDVITEDQWQWQEPGTAWRGNKKKSVSSVGTDLDFWGGLFRPCQFLLASQ